MSKGHAEHVNLTNIYQLKDHLSILTRVRARIYRQGEGRRLTADKLKLKTFLTMLQTILNLKKQISVGYFNAFLMRD